MAAEVASPPWQALAKRLGASLGPPRSPTGAGQVEHPGGRGARAVVAGVAATQAVRRLAAQPRSRPELRCSPPGPRSAPAAGGEARAPGPELLLGDAVELRSKEGRIGFLQQSALGAGVGIVAGEKCVVLRPDGLKLMDVALDDVKRLVCRPAAGPNVSVQVMTFSRPHFLQHALELISQQDAPRDSFEVIVIDDSPVCTLTCDILRGLDDGFLRENLRYVHLEQRLSIGAKRNLAAALSRGSLVMHWDDDDYYGPTRIRQQSEPILSGQADVTLVPLTWTFHVRDASGPDGFYRANGDTGGDMCTICYRRSLWSEHDALRRYPDTSLMEDLFLFRNLTGIDGASVEVLDEGAVDFLYVKHRLSASATPRVGRLVAGGPPFLPAATRQLLGRLRDEGLPAEPPQTIVGQVQQELSFLDVYLQGADEGLHIPRRYFMDLARMIPMIPDARDRQRNLEHLASRLLAGGLGRLDGESLALAAWCCSTSRLPASSALWLEICRAAEAAAPALPPASLSMLAYVAGRMGLREGRLPEALFSRAGELCESLAPQDIVNLLSAMARLEVDNEPVMISLMLRFPPSEFTSVEWLRLTWSVHRLRPEWAEQGYFPRFVSCPPAITEVVFEKLYALARRRDAQVYCYEPPIILLRSFATPAECRQLQELVEVQGWQRTENVVRKVSAAILNQSQTARHPLVVELRTRAAALVGLPAQHCESLNCVRYVSGEQHRAHYDYIQDVDVRFAVGQPDPLTENSMLLGGQRHCTVLIYLNELDEGDGGETFFEHLGVRVQPQLGAALVWPNVGRDGQPNPLTMHASLPVDGAEKLVANAWLRVEDAGLMRPAATR